MKTTVNSWPVNDGYEATFGPDDFERWWLHGMSRHDPLAENDIAELIAACIELAQSESRQMTQTEQELTSAARRWAAEWNSKC